MLTEQDRAEISQLLAEELEKDYFRRRSIRLQDHERAEAAKETHVFLLTLTGHQLAFPDENGRAILTQCVYARVTVDPKNANFFGGTVDVVAQSDGRLMAKPLKLTLTGSGVVGMVQVDESILKP